MFPLGWSGFALLLLRVSVASTLIVSPSSHDLPSWHLWRLIPLCAALCAGAGLVTPLAGLLSVGVQLLRCATSNTPLLWASVTMLNAMVLTMLGPGGYSVDALIFGRRLLISNRDD